MLQGYTHTQALRMYRTYGVRVAVPLSPLALRKARSAASKRVAGLNELAAQQLPTVRRGIFQTDAEFAAELLAMRAEVAEGVPVRQALAQHNFSYRAIA